MNNVSKLLVVCICLLSFVLTGCASISEIAPAGKDTYMIAASSLGFGTAGATLKAKLYTKANLYCTKQNKVLFPVSDSSVDYRAFRGMANAELTFRCLNEDDPELNRPKLRKEPDTAIEINK